MEGFFSRFRITMPFSAAYTGDYPGLSNSSDPVELPRNRRTFWWTQTFAGAGGGVPIVWPKEFGELKTGTPQTVTAFSVGFQPCSSARTRMNFEDNYVEGFVPYMERRALNEFCYIATLGAFKNQHGRVPIPLPALSEYLTFDGTKEYPFDGNGVQGYPKGSIQRTMYKVWKRGKAQDEIHWLCDDIISTIDENPISEYVMSSRDLQDKNFPWKIVRSVPLKGMPRILPNLSTVQNFNEEKQVFPVVSIYALSNKPLSSPIVMVKTFTSEWWESNAGGSSAADYLFPTYYVNPRRSEFIPFLALYGISKPKSDDILISVAED